MDFPTACGYSRETYELFPERMLNVNFRSPDFRGKYISFQVDFLESPPIKNKLFSTLTPLESPDMYASTCIDERSKGFSNGTAKSTYASIKSPRFTGPVGILTLKKCLSCIGPLSSSACSFLAASSSALRSFSISAACFSARASASRWAASFASRSKRSFSFESVHETVRAPAHSAHKDIVKSLYIRCFIAYDKLKFFQS